MSSSGRALSAATCIALLVSFADPCSVARGQGGAAILAPPLEQAGKPATAGNPAAMANVPGAKMAANFAAGGGAPAAAGAAAEASGPVGGHLKYMPAYAVAVLAAGLGLFVVCRGSGRRRDSV